MPKHTLVMPFLNGEEAYALGVEFGMLYSRMKSDDEVKDYFCRENQDQILLAASRLGWRVVEMKPHDDDWFWLHMVRP
jgi:hypothetical protein